MTRIVDFKEGKGKIPGEQKGWPLYGDGLESLGKDGKPVVLPVGEYGENQLLMRIDTVSLCYTDVKEINLGSKHPRLSGRDMAKNPIIPGHEVCMTVVGVGKDLQGEYHVGQRLSLQPDVWVDGVSIPFCFGMDGGYRQYAVIGQEILNGDAGNYLIPVPEDMSYAAAAITEPWACVEAAYRMEYRDHIKSDGVMWIVAGERIRSGYKFDSLFCESRKPAMVILSNVGEEIKSAFDRLSQVYSFTVVEEKIDKCIDCETQFDDIVVLDCGREVIDRVSPKLAKGGVLAILREKAGDENIFINLGRLHYDDIYFVGDVGLDVNKAYTQKKPRVELKPEGKAWILGAGGPMGRMHLQRAIESHTGPALIVASEVTPERYESLKNDFTELAQNHNKELVFLNAVAEPEEYAKTMQKIKDSGGFNDIEIMITIKPVIADAALYLAPRGVMNLFAGLKRGEGIEMDASLIYGEKQVRLIGHSGSGLDDQKAIVQRFIRKQLKPQLSVAAIGGLCQIADGIKAMEDWVYPGKIVIYPHVLDFPLTALHEFAKKDPDLYRLIQKEKCWSQAAEEYFLNKELSD
ncbi:MAG: alcohol dehydrogenase catalytic domain-containing protein [Anaerolineales bacterium]|nr:alcohol dehydrogenase catalytic domain-containing protein [Anaerolineales bacterium]